MLAPFARKPIVDITEDFVPRSLQASLSVPTEVSGVRGVMQVIEKGEKGEIR